MQRSERGQLLIDQLEFGLEELEASAGEDEALGRRAAAGTNVEAFTRARPSRKPLPVHLRSSPASNLADGRGGAFQLHRQAA